DYLDHAYVFAAADGPDLRSLLGQTTRAVGRSLADYHAETFSALETRGRPLSEVQTRRKAIAELLLHRAGDAPEGLVSAVQTIGRLEDRLDRHENRYWYDVIHAHEALARGDAEAFVDALLTLWLEVVTPLEVPFETYETLALTENGHAGFVRALPHLHESIARLILVHSQTAALDGDIDSLGSLVRVLTDERVGADPDAVPLEASSKALLDHVVTRLDGAESDGGSLTYTLALVGAERAHQIARRRLAEEGFSDAAEAAVRDSVAAYQRALRHAHTLQGQVAVYTRALRQLGEVYATAERLGVEATVDVPFSLERAYALHETLHAHAQSGWERDGYVDVGRDAFVDAMQGLWSEIQEASTNAARYYLTRRDATGERDDESIVHAINHSSRYLHAFERFEGDPKGESLPSSAYFGAYLAARRIGDGVLFFAGGDASVEQLEEAIAQYTRALAYFPFDRELWTTLAVALQRSGRESDFLAVAKPIAERVIHSRHLDRWISRGAERADELASFRRAFSNDRSLVYFGFADEQKLDSLDSEFARLQQERERIAEAIAETRTQRSRLDRRRAEAHRLAAELSGENEAPSPPGVVSAPRSPESAAIARLGVDLERLGSSSERLEARIDAIAESLPIFKATLGHEDLVWELGSQRDHPVHELLRRLAEEVTEPTLRTGAPSETGRSSGSLLESWLGGIQE
ncbi:MAG: coiled-coil domain-containing protein, partial [bacterium]